MSINTITLIGFGEVGQTLAEAFVKTSEGRLTLHAVDPKFNDKTSPHREHAKDLNVQDFQDISQAIQNTDLIISAVTAAQTIVAAHEVAPSIPDGCWYLDVNSSSPRMKIEAAMTINDSGGRYIESSIMSPINPKKLNVPLLLGGQHAEEFSKIAQGIASLKRAIIAVSLEKRRQQNFAEVFSLKVWKH